MKPTLEQRIKAKQERILSYDDKNHHPVEKIKQLNQLDLVDYKILEVFAGRGNLTSYYNTKSYDVTSLALLDNIEKIVDNTIKDMMTKVNDSNTYIHKLIYDEIKYDLIDVDPYNDGGQLAQNIFKLLNDNSYLIWTFPFVNAGSPPNKHKKHRYNMYWSSTNPNLDMFCDKVKEYASLSLFKVEPVSVIKFNKMRRVIFKCTKHKSTEIVEQFI